MLFRSMDAQAWARQNVASAVARSRRAYLGTLPKYPDGSKVWLFTPIVDSSKSKKFTQFWSGPWTVSRCINPATYEIAPHPTWTKSKVEVVSVDRLKAYKCSPIDDLDRYNQPPPIGLDLSMQGDEFAEHVILSDGVEAPQAPVPNQHLHLPEQPAAPEAAAAPDDAPVPVLQPVQAPPGEAQRPAARRRRRQVDILLEEAAMYVGEAPPNPRRQRRGASPQPAPPQPDQALDDSFHSANEDPVADDL